MISIESDLVIVDVGLKTEGRISLNEFSSHDGSHSLEIGDQVDVYLERIENALGDAVLSRDKAKREENWIKLEEDQENNVIVEGIINWFSCMFLYCFKCLFFPMMIKPIIIFNMVTRWYE